MDDALRKDGGILPFLDPREQLLCERHLGGAATAFFDGGYPDAIRKRLIIGNELSKIKAVSFSHAGFKNLNHRDYLGAIMSLGIKRELTGDIISGETGATLFATEEAAVFIAENIRKIGSCGVKVEILDRLPQIENPHEFEDLRFTVISLRLDVVVSAIFKTSRSRAAEAISEGLITLDFEKCFDATKQVKQGSQISMRGFGKYLIENTENITKKGKIILCVRKYK